MDLFNHGYYWEAHEAWEPLWRASDRSSADRALLKGLIFMAAAGVKRREGKAIAARRHGGRAAALFRSAAAQPGSSAQGMLGLSLETLAVHAEASGSMISAPAADGANIAVVFPASLGGFAWKE